MVDLKLPKDFPPINVELSAGVVQRLRYVPEDLRWQATRAILNYRARELREWSKWINPKRVEDQAT